MRAPSKFNRPAGTTRVPSTRRQDARRAAGVRRILARASSLLMLALAASALSATTLAQIHLTQGSLTDNRNRLMEGYAKRTGAPSKCHAWLWMTDVQRGVFLTITDLLGKRSYFQNGQYTYSAIPTSCNGYQQTDCTHGCYQYVPGWYGVYGCRGLSGSECYAMGQCYREPIPRTAQPAFNEYYGTYAETALDHVTKIYAVRHADDCGGSGNRIFFSADDGLISHIRNKELGLPAWGYSSDLAGPHDPFTNDSETARGRPRGQMHFWSWDYEARPLWGDGLYGDYDPHMVEIDIDYNSRHHSNPQCHYDDLPGRIYYQNFWQGHGVGGDAELNYSACASPSPNRTDDQQFFVWQQFWDHFGRTPDQSGMAAWLNYINACGGDPQCLTFRRTETARGFIDSGEFRSTHPGLQNPGSAEYNQEFVRQCFLVYLRREPDPGGYSAWLNYLNNTGDEHTVVHGFIYSQEYRSRFGQP